MALDIRLDFITDIDPIQINHMTEMRHKFIELDEELKVIADSLVDNPAGARVIALARTNLEIACQFTIKSLCILGEIHER